MGNVESRQREMIVHVLELEKLVDESQTFLSVADPGRTWQPLASIALDDLPHRGTI